MKIPINDREMGVQPTKLSLQKLVSRLVGHFQPAAVQHASFILNDIPEDLWVSTDETILASVMGSMLNSIIKKNKSACIRVSARSYNNIVVIDVRDNMNGSERIPKELEEVQPLAEQLGGCITLNRLENNVTTVALSFFSPSIAA